MRPHEKITVVLPHEMIKRIHRAVEAGEFPSSSEAVHEALREWTHKRSLRRKRADELRAAWRDAIESKKPGVPLDPVLQRLTHKYQALPGKTNAAH